MSANTIIIGGGVIGLSIARALRRRGEQHVAVLEKGVCGREASWAAGGMLTAQAHTYQQDTFYRLSASSRDLYPALAEELLSETGIDIELDRTGTLVLAFTDDEADDLADRLAKQSAAGLHAEILDRPDVLAAEPGISPVVAAALRFENDWQVENRQLVEALRRYAALNGIEIREHTEVERVIIENGRVTGVSANGDTVGCDHVIIAGGAWSSAIGVGNAPLPFAVSPVRGQIVEYTTREMAVRHVIYCSGGYLVPRRGGRILVGSTLEHAGFEKTTTEKAMAGLRDVGERILPQLADQALSGSWSGLRPFAPDEMPILGPFGGIEGLFAATAHYLNGILLAPITAEIMADAVIYGGRSEYFSEFGPERAAVAAP